MGIDHSRREGEPKPADAPADPLDGSGAADASDGWHRPDRLAGAPDRLIVAGPRCGPAPKNQSRIIDHLKTVLTASARTDRW